MAELDHLLARLAMGLVDGADAGVPLPSRLCTSAARVLDCDGGAITMAYTLSSRVTLTTTDQTATVLEDAQDVTGQGPGPDAFTSGAYQRMDLDGVAARDERWPLLGFDSVPDLAPLVIHAIPLPSRATVLGVITLYQRGAGRTIDLEAAEVVARAVTASLVADVPVGFEDDRGPWAKRAEVHQATGMVVAQLGIPEEDALALIRAHAYSHDQGVDHSAHAIVTRKLVFTAAPGDEIEST